MDTFASNMAPENQKVIKDSGKIKSDGNNNKDIVEKDLIFLSEFTTADGDLYTFKQIFEMPEQEKKNTLDRLKIQTKDVNSTYMDKWKEAKQIDNENRRNHGE